MPTCLRPCCSNALFDSFLPQRSRGRRTRTERGAGSEGVGSSMDGGGTGGQGGRTCWEATTTEVRRPECHSAASLWLESVFERRALITCCCREERSGWNDGPGTFLCSDYVDSKCFSARLGRCLSTCHTSGFTTTAYVLKDLLWLSVVQHTAASGITLFDWAEQHQLVHNHECMLCGKSFFRTLKQYFEFWFKFQ